MKTAKVFCAVGTADSIDEIMANFEQFLNEQETEPEEGEAQEVEAVAQESAPPLVVNVQPAVDGERYYVHANHLNRSDPSESVCVAATQKESHAKLVAKGLRMILPKVIGQ